MNEPTPQPPAPNTGQAQQPPTPPQQAPQNTPPAPQQTAPTPPATPPVGTPPAPNTPPAAPPSPALNPQQIAQMQQQNAEAQRKITEQGQQLADLKRQRDALVGVTPPAPQADPIAPIIADLVADGMHPDDAKVMAKGIHRATAPYREQLQQQQQSIMGTAMIGTVMQQAWTENPALFAANPQIGQRVEQMLRNNAMTGQGPVDKDFALAVAKIEWADAHFAAQTGQQPPTLAQLAPSFQSMYAPPPGFTAPAPAQQAPVRTPEQQAWDAEIKQTFKTDKRTA